MARVTKAPELRREELLDVAFALCRSDGFEAMSVEQVTQSAGVAKGTFYHYFSSKADLQLQLVQRLGEALFAHLSTQVAAAPGTAAERIRTLMDAAAAYKAETFDVSVAPFLYRDVNYALRHRLFDAWREHARTVLRPVISDGIADGSLAVTDAEAAADLVLLLWFEAADHLWLRAVAAPDQDAFVDVLQTGSAALWQAQDRILGVREGTFAVPFGAETLAAIKALHTSLEGNQP
ncbi:MAG: TetR/AcrR family transcriptional regulator [Propionibacteriaceae bacterium]|nr:TetR/AcrR family transcriptional regulator [Propionibacteriaceae bacterium]